MKCLKRTGADGIMIGRSVFGDPWVFEEVAYALRGEEYPGRPCLADRIAVAVKQFQLSEEDHGEKNACLEARKHFAWYLRGVSHSSYYKNQITSLTTMEDIYRMVSAFADTASTGTRIIHNKNRFTSSPLGLGYGAVFIFICGNYFRSRTTSFATR